MWRHKQATWIVHLFLVYIVLRGYTHAYVQVNMATHAGCDPSLKEVNEQENINEVTIIYWMEKPSGQFSGKS